MGKTATTLCVCAPMTVQKKSLFCHSFGLHTAAELETHKKCSVIYYIRQFIDQIIKQSENAKTTNGLVWWNVVGGGEMKAK